MIRIRVMVSLAVLAMLSLGASPVVAQTCLGVPMTVGNTAVMAGAAFPDNANVFGFGLAHQANENVSVGASYDLTTFDDVLGDIPSAHTVSGNASYEIMLQQPEQPASFGLCPTVGAGYTKWDDLSVVSVPIGVGLGAAIPIAEGTATLAPYALPRFVWARASMDGFESESDTDFGFSLGANALMGNLLFGASVTKIGDADATFGIRAGFIF